MFTTRLVSDGHGSRAQDILDLTVTDSTSTLIAERVLKCNHWQLSLPIYCIKCEVFCFCIGEAELAQYLALYRSWYIHVHTIYYYIINPMLVQIERFRSKARTSTWR